MFTSIFFTYLKFYPAVVPLHLLLCSNPFPPSSPDNLIIDASLSKLCGIVACLPTYEHARRWLVAVVDGWWPDASEEGKTHWSPCMAMGNIMVSILDTLQRVLKGVNALQVVYLLYLWATINRHIILIGVIPMLFFM